MRVRCFSQLLIDSEIGLRIVSRAARQAVRQAIRQVDSTLDPAFAALVFYLMASLVLKNRNPKTVKLAEKASTVD